MTTLYEGVLDQVAAGTCQEDFQENPDVHIERLNEMTNEEMLQCISDVVEELK